MKLWNNAQVNLVFIHLNSKLPRYLQLSLRLHRERFPKIPIYLLYSASQHVSRISGIEMVPIREEHRWKQLDSLYTHPKDFRKNFWLTSSVRLFALENFVNQGITEVLHVESDVILAEDFPFGKFTGLDQGIAFPLISELRAAASTVYVRNGDYASLLTSNMIEEATINPQTTEMLILKKLYDSNSKVIQPLPIGGMSSQYYRNIEPEFEKKIIESLEYFGGVFDGVEIGQFFFGTDPRNRRGKILIGHDLVNGYINIPEVILEFNESRKFPNMHLEHSSEGEKLFSLHIPSKEFRYFHSKQSENAVRRATYRNKTPKDQYSLKSIAVGLLQFVARRLLKPHRKRIF